MFGQGQYTFGAAVAGYFSNPAATELGNVHMVLVLKAKMQDWGGGCHGEPLSQAPWSRSMVSVERL